MRPWVKAMREWPRRAPHWTALLLGVLVMMEAGHYVLRLAGEARTADGARQSAAHPQTSRLAFPDPEQIARAHLFGLDPAAAQAGADGLAETQLHLALSGVIATSDPYEGYAMLGEQDHPTRLYRTGAALTDGGGGRLYQVFTDHVVLDFGGRRERLGLPRHELDTSAAVRLARLDSPAAPATATLVSQREEPPSAVEGWFSNLYAEHYSADGRTGLRLHPAKHFQRRYGLRDGDTLTAVNGVPVGDEEAVADILRAGGKSVALTLTRDGVVETLKVAIEQ